MALDVFKRNNLVLPRVYLGSLNLSGLSFQQVRERVSQAAAQFLDAPFQIAARGSVKTATYREMGASFDFEATLAAVPFAAKANAPEMVFMGIAGQRILPIFSIENTDVLRLINQKFPDIPRVKNAQIAKIKGGIEIIDAQEGLVPDIARLQKKIADNLMFFEPLPLFVFFQQSAPTVARRDLERYKDNIAAVFPRKIALIYERQKWEADFVQNPQWIVFERRPVSPNSFLPFDLQWDQIAYTSYIEPIAKELEQPAEGVRMQMMPQGRVQFEGRGYEGRAAEQDLLLEKANSAIALGAITVQIPMKIVAPKIEISENLQKMGINELIGVGHTKFAGSPPNRIHNIGIGVSKFNGLIIPAGETFSFGNNLGSVDDSTGFKKELVIKPEGTIPEFGGGLCQVSTTMYRAALYSGLPIVERAPHSYVVRYYSQVGGHGLDATVYPPARDLKFKNDTSAPIVIQSFVDGFDAYFKFYGASDGRQVALEGPYISNRQAAPTEPLLIPDKTLEPGEKKQVEKPHDGFNATWYRYITQNGTTSKETIFSRYQAIPAKFLVGGELSSAGENKGLSTPPSAQNPFE